MPLKAPSVYSKSCSAHPLKRLVAIWSSLLDMDLEHLNSGTSNSLIYLFIYVPVYVQIYLSIDLPTYLLPIYMYIYIYVYIYIFIFICICTYNTKNQKECDRTTWRFGTQASQQLLEAPCLPLLLRLEALALTAAGVALRLPRTRAVQDHIRAVGRTPYLKPGSPLIRSPYSPYITSF